MPMKNASRGNWSLKTLKLSVKSVYFWLNSIASVDFTHVELYAMIFYVLANNFAYFTEAKVYLKSVIYFLRSDFSLLLQIYQNTKINMLVFWYLCTSSFFRAQKILDENYLGATNASFSGLLTILAIPTILKILVFTNKSSSNYTAFKRYVQTIYHTLTWYRNDLRPGTKAWKSLETVRKLHLSANKSASRNNMGIISQKDMAITQFGFMGYLVLSGRKLGLFLSKDEVDCILHFWRVHGFLMGIHEE